MMANPDSPPVGMTIEVSPSRDKGMTTSSTLEFFNPTKWIEKAMMKIIAKQTTSSKHTDRSGSRAKLHVDKNSNITGGDLL